MEGFIFGLDQCFIKSSSGVKPSSLSTFLSPVPIAVTSWLPYPSLHTTVHACLQHHMISWAWVGKITVWTEGKEHSSKTFLRCVVIWLCACKICNVWRLGRMSRQRANAGRTVFIEQRVRTTLTMLDCGDIQQWAQILVHCTCRTSAAYSGCRERPSHFVCTVLETPIYHEPGIWSRP